MQRGRAVGIPSLNRASEIARSSEARGIQTALRSIDYTSRVVFKWDPRKATANLTKHGGDFHEAATVLNDVLSTTYPDTDHSSAAEPRFVTIGMSGRNRVLVVAHTEQGEAIRIITARRNP